MTDPVTTVGETVRPGGGGRLHHPHLQELISVAVDWVTEKGAPRTSLEARMKKATWTSPTLEGLARKVLNDTRTGKTGKVNSLTIEIGGGPRIVQVMINRTGCTVFARAEDRYLIRELTAHVEEILGDAGVRRWKWRVPTGIRLLDRHRPSGRELARRTSLYLLVSIATIAGAVATVVGLILTVV